MTENTQVQTTETNIQNNYKKVRPRVDIFDNDDEVLLVADMPGVTKSDLNIQVVDGKLEICGIRKLENVGRQTWQEFENVEYKTAFQLSKEIDGTGAKAEFVDGVLTIRLARTEAAKPKKILVQ